MSEKLYANIPIAVNDPEYFQKANEYLNNLGLTEILKLLGYDKVEEAELIYDGLYTKKYNHHAKQWEPDTKTALSYMRHIATVTKQEKKEVANAEPVVNVIFPDWYLQKREREEESYGHLLRISVHDDIAVGENISN